MNNTIVHYVNDDLVEITAQIENTVTVCKIENTPNGLIRTSIISDLFKDPLVRMTDLDGYASFQEYTSHYITRLYETRDTISGITTEMYFFERFGDNEELKAYIYNE